MKEPANALARINVGLHLPQEGDLRRGDRASVQGHPAGQRPEGDAVRALLSRAGVPRAGDVRGRADVLPEDAQARAQPDRGLLRAGPRPVVRRTTATRRCRPGPRGTRPTSSIPGPSGARRCSTWPPPEVRSRAVLRSPDRFSFSYLPGRVPAAVQVGRVTAVAWPDQLPLAVDLARRRRTGPPSGPVSAAGPRAASAHRRARWPRARLAHRRPRARMGRRRSRMPGTRTILLRADRPSSPAPSATSWPIWRCTRRCASGPALVRRGLRRLGRRRVGPAGCCSSSTWPSCGAPSRTSSASTARSGARQTTADAAYALAASAVAELARRNPTGALDAALAPGAGEIFDAAVLATTGLTVDGSMRRGSRRLGGATAWAPGCWPAAGGSWWPLVLVALVRFRRRADRAARAALDEGWEVDPEARAGLNLTRPVPQ